MPQPRAVILDVDGTLIASNDAHARAFVDAGRELGRESDFDDVRRLIGKGGDKLIPEIFGVEKESPEGERISGRKKQIFEEKYLPLLEPTPGARSLVLRLRDDGLKLVIATSAGRDELDGLLERAGIADLVQDATSSSDVAESKPDPDIVLAALEKTGYEADEVVMLGDTPYDVEAASRAGVRIVAVRSGGWTDEDLAGSVAVYEHPAALLAAYDESPLGRGRGAA
ncbi:MAG: HAD family hydrolase [Gemmatimonadota bacterium]|nr:HAD family hydrolase [Gemmatimonadota bacterium]